MASLVGEVGCVDGIESDAPVGLGIDGELCARLACLLDAAMAGGDYVYTDSVRGMVIDLIANTELRLRARAALSAATRRGDLALVQSLTAALVECEGGWVVWREKALALLEPAAVEPPPVESVS